MGSPPTVLLVDLNNYARYPTLAIGSMVAALRGRGIGTHVLCPFQHGVPTIEREGQETRLAYLAKRAQLSSHPLLASGRNLAERALKGWAARPHPVTLELVERSIGELRPDAVLVSTYLDYYPTVVRLCAIARSRQRPVLVGGPMFNIPEIADAWRGIPGLTAVVGAEVDHSLPDLVEDLVAGRDLTTHPGVLLPSGERGEPAPPLQELDDLPIPDFSDFPWANYPVRVIPAMAGRGCGWGRCTFCGDVATANGRGFRARPVDRVLDELVAQSERYGTRDVMFLDIKLNSDVALWRGIIDGFQRRLPGGRWIGTVHVGMEPDNGLSKADLERARESGLVRTSFGLETASERVNRSMSKGTRVEAMSRFVRDAHDVGISVRASAMLGYPGEVADDVDSTTRFLERHRGQMDRIRMSRFKPLPGTRFHRHYVRAPERFPSLRGLEWDFRLGRARYLQGAGRDRGYRRATARLLRVVHEINREPLREGLEAFDGLM